MEEYIRFLEFCRKMMRDNDTLAGNIARRTRPVEEMFVLP